MFKRIKVLSLLQWWKFNIDLLEVTFEKISTKDSIAETCLLQDTASEMSYVVHRLVVYINNF